MITKEFLETYPLYRKLKVDEPYYNTQLDDISTPAINMYCKSCGSVQTFNISNEIWEILASNEYGAKTIDVWGVPIRMRYLCSACNSYFYHFYVLFSLKTKAEKNGTIYYSGSVQKIGQTPQWEIDMDPKLEKTLGEHADLYKKGLVCESESYGIGAYAYFRQITEKIIDELLISVEDLIDEEDKGKYKDALDQVKKTRVAEQKIELVQDLLPTSLQPNGNNPLKLLHSSLSDGLHNRTDEECLESADNIKNILIYLVEEIQTRKSKAKTFTDKMKKLLEKKK